MDWSLQALQIIRKLFSNFGFVFELMAENQKIYITNSEVWISIKFQCVMYQWIFLDKLYKLMESFFLNLGIIFQISYNVLK